MGALNQKDTGMVKASDIATVGEVCLCACMYARGYIYIYIYIHMTIPILSGWQKNDILYTYMYIHTCKHTYSVRERDIPSGLKTPHTYTNNSIHTYIQCAREAARFPSITDP